MKGSCSELEHTVIIGAGPCGLASALALHQKDIDPLIIEKGNVVEAIYRYPTHQTFFSSSDKLEIGNIPFINEKPKPVRKDALTYYREVAKRNNLRINAFEKVIKINKLADEHIVVETNKHSYVAKNVIIATGYYGQPQLLNIPGETLPKVSHYFKEAHPFYNQNVVVIGGKNSAVDAAIELERAGANVTVLYRGSDYSPSVKPWILPEFTSLVRREAISLQFNAHVTEIAPSTVSYKIGDEKYKIENDFVFAMTGYMPDITLLHEAGVKVDMKTGRPTFDEQTFETNIENIYVAGVVISGFNGNETFIENGRYHGEHIAKHISKHK